MEENTKLGDVYYRRDYPVLVLIAEAELDPEIQQLPPPPEQIAASLDRPLPDVCASLGRLRRAGYITGDPLMRGIKDYLVITSVTTSGLREVGAYPSAADLGDRLHRFLEEEAAILERTDPERGRKIRQALTSLADLGTTFAAKFAAELAKPS